MTFSHFPVQLLLEGKPCLVVGGAGEALEKTRRLLDAGARITIVSPRLLPALSRRVRSHSFEGNSLPSIRWLRRRFRDSDVRGKFLVMNTVKTDESLSRRIFRACQREGCLISSYDQPNYSNCVMPWLVRRGSLRIAISTGGISPGLARRIGHELRRIFDDRAARFLAELGRLRRKWIRQGVPAQARRARFRKLLAGFRLRGRLVYPRLT